jgi:Tol biopolymer transport system component
MREAGQGRRLLQLVMRMTGIAPLWCGLVLAGTTERVSVAWDGAQGDGPSSSPSISAHGRFVAFASWATNLVPNDTNGGRDIFVRDREVGHTARVSVGSDGAEANAGSMGPSISADGRFVAFRSSASNLVADDTNGVDDIFVHDRETGETIRASVTTDGAEADRISYWPRMSADGRFVVFSSDATNLVPGDTNGVTDIFVRDLVSSETTRASVASDGSEGRGVSFGPSVSADGRIVVFASDAWDLVPGSVGGEHHIFARDRQTQQTTRVTDTGIEGELSPGGRFLAFVSFTPGGFPSFDFKVLVHDRQNGPSRNASVAWDGAPADGDSRSPSISESGATVAYESDATNLIPGDTNGLRDIYVRNLWTGEIERASVASDGTQGDASSSNAVVSADGRFVAFESSATMLVPSDTNGALDVFVRVRAEGAESIVCVDDGNATGLEDGTPGHPSNSIQEGIEAVLSGGTVKVARGTYRENLLLNGQTATVKGGYPGGSYPGTGDFREESRNGNPLTNNTVIDGGGQTVTCQGGAPPSVLVGFSFRNGRVHIRGAVHLRSVAIRSPGR